MEHGRRRPAHPALRRHARPPGAASPRAPAELLARKVPALREPRRRLRLVLLATLTLASTLALLTAQALIGQSIVKPTGTILTAGILLTAAAVTATIVIMTTSSDSRREPPQPDRTDRSPKAAT